MWSAASKLWRRMECKQEEGREGARKLHF